MDKEPDCNTGHRRLPAWLKRPLPHGKDYVHVETLLRELHLHTVCRSARCPNLGECWSAGTATFMILGKTCSRNCRFCAVDKGTPLPPDADEPLRVAQAAQAMKLRHVVITSVTRDDLADEGAGHFARSVLEVRKVLPDSTLEVLTPDFHARPDCLDTVSRAQPRVFNHNLETVEPLTLLIRPQADYRRSLTVLSYVRSGFPNILVKSGLMVGLGETDEQIHQSLRDLANAGCQIVTVGQYLAPSSDHYPTQRYLPPEWFKELTEWATQNFSFVAFAANPFVRSSYLAHELVGNAK
jgi:lipoyl synthase